MLQAVELIENVFRRASTSKLPFQFIFTLKCVKIDLMMEGKGKSKHMSLTLRFSVEYDFRSNFSFSCGINFNVEIIRNDRTVDFVFFYTMYRNFDN